MMAFYFQQLLETLPFFLKGLWMTVAVSALGLIFATVLGFLLGVMRASSKKLLTWPIGAYVFVIRGTPFVVQIFIIFFIFPEWGIQLDAFPTAVLALTILGTAFICEIVAGDRGRRY
jgi:polar amino acid transport system permease protein